MNDILAFADDTLVFAESLFDIRRAIDGLSLEIKRMGLEINPAKCSIMMNNMDLEKEEIVPCSLIKFKNGEIIEGPSDLFHKMP